MTIPLPRIGINRVHRLNSRSHITVNPIICDASIDRKLEAGIHERKDAAELVLDGRLLAQVSHNLKQTLDNHSPFFLGTTISTGFLVGATTLAWGNLSHWIPNAR